ncbi:MAG: prepilin peptidase [Gammaproteobacteria bacterium]
MTWQNTLLLAWGTGCALCDWKHRRIPNYLTLGLTGFAIIYLVARGHSVLGASPFSAIAAGTGTIVALFPFAWRGSLGAGDVKMMSAIGFIGGIEFVATTFVLSTMFTVPVVLWIWLSGTLKQKPSPLKNLRLPQGIFITLGLLLCLLADPNTRYAQ